MSGTQTLVLMAWQQSCFLQKLRCLLPGSWLWERQGPGHGDPWANAKHHWPSVCPVRLARAETGRALPVSCGVRKFLPTSLESTRPWLWPLLALLQPKQVPKGPRGREDHGSHGAGVSSTTYKMSLNDSGRDLERMRAKAKTIPRALEKSGVDSHGGFSSPTTVLMEIRFQLWRSRVPLPVYTQTHTAYLPPPWNRGCDLSLLTLLNTRQVWTDPQSFQGHGNWPGRHVVFATNLLFYVILSYFFHFIICCCIFFFFLTPNSEYVFLQEWPFRLPGWTGVGQNMAFLFFLGNNSGRAGRAAGPKV